MEPTLLRMEHLQPRVSPCQTKMRFLLCKRSKHTIVIKLILSSKFIWISLFSFNNYSVFGLFQQWFPPFEKTKDRALQAPQIMANLKLIHFDLIPTYFNCLQTFVDIRKNVGHNLWPTFFLISTKV